MWASRLRFEDAWLRYVSPSEVQECKESLNHTGYGPISKCKAEGEPCTSESGEKPHGSADPCSLVLENGVSRGEGGYETLKAAIVELDLEPVEASDEPAH